MKIQWKSAGVGALVGASTASVWLLAAYSERFGKSDKQMTATRFPREIRTETPPAVKYGWPSRMNVKIREGYVASYDRRLRNPAWVAEHLTLEYLQLNESLDSENSRNSPKQSKIDRKHCAFKEDESIPSRFRTSPQDFRRTGYDRGHLAPARDMPRSLTALQDSFYMSNVSPQVGAGFNRGYWSRFEGFVRHLTRHFKDVYVVTGPLYLPKKIDGKFVVKYEAIGNPPTIAVPTHFFKVILAESATGELYSCAFILPNEPISITTPLKSFLKPIEEIENFSGLLFFQQVPLERGVKELCTQVACKVKASEFNQMVKAKANAKQHKQ